MQELEFLTFRPELAPYFEAINKQWIVDMFTLEAADRETLEHPQERIIDTGGQIWFAKHAERGILGCCAVMPKGEGAFELTKMGVLPESRGLKVGEKLLQHVLKQVQAMPVDRLFLLTNKDCEAAIHLYERNGFVHDQGVMDTYGGSYGRCDVAMKFQSIWSEEAPGTN
ncbi:MAG: GNAT family N-acetyltransferase [Planctomycetota bacterium]|nr:GNAT family N-acetyltransferase [Planctomycetota bacterium]